MSEGNTDQPWFLSNFQYGSGIAALHTEIEHFYSYVVCTPTEYKMRQEAVQRVKNLLHSLWPQTHIEVFGSFRTGLNLPISDIDIALNRFDWNDGAPLLELKAALIIRGIASEVHVLDKAAVPVVKFTERISKIKFDISFNTTTGVKAAELMLKYIQQFPELPRLVIVLKQFLKLQGLNVVYRAGGISSYGITLMCISFLHQQQNSSKNHRLGRLLLKFLDFYGRKFDYYKYGITICGTVEKSFLQQRFGDCSWLSVLTIQDPITPSNDIGRSSFNALDVKRCFADAFLKLSRLVDLDASKVNGSLLACIVQVPESVISYRNWVQIEFQHLNSNQEKEHKHFFKSRMQSEKTKQHLEKNK